MRQSLAGEGTLLPAEGNGAVAARRAHIPQVVGSSPTSPTATGAQHEAACLHSSRLARPSDSAWLPSRFLSLP